MSVALQHTTEITLDQPDEASARIFARQMYTLLIHLCEGRALAIVRGAPDHSGLDAWRLQHEWYQPKTRSRGLALLNEILGWDFGTKKQFLQRMKDWESASLEYNRTASAPLQEELLVAVLISRSPKKVRTYLHVQVQEETAKLSRVRPLRAGKTWKAPRTEEVAETNFPNLVPMDVDSLCVPWLVRHATWLLHRFQRRQNGATAFENLKGVSHEKPLMQFGERCHWLEADESRTNMILVGELEIGWDDTLHQTHT